MDTPEKRSEPIAQLHGDLVELLSRKIVGQSNALQFIIPYLRM